MAHNDRCKFAKSKRKDCECRCGGSLHGFGLKGNDKVGLGEIVMSEEMGGEIADVVRRTRGVVIPVHSFCEHEIPVVWLGLPHDGGLPDASGKRYWMYVECDECGYAASYWKVLRRLEAGLLVLPSGR